MFLLVGPDGALKGVDRILTWSKVPRSICSTVEAGNLSSGQICVIPRIMDFSCFWMELS